MLSHALRAAAGNQAPVTPTDPNFNQVALLLHGDGTNGAQNNTFLDSSTNNFTVTRTGTPTQGTFTPFSQDAGYWSNFFNGSPTYLSVPNTSIGNLTGNQFTIECNIYLAAYPTLTSFYASTIFSTTSTATANGGNFGFLFALAGTVNSYTSVYIQANNSSLSYSANFSFALNTWYHVALTRTSAGVFTIYVNGTSIGTTTNTTTWIDNSPYAIGRNNQTSFNYYFPGYMSNLRLVIGSVVYTSNFTPPTTPLTAITNTKLLTCQSNRFVDNSSLNNTITANGTPSVQPWSPFAPTSAYSTSVNGGSLYLSGAASNYATIAQTTTLDLPADFTLEAWVYTTSTAEQAIGGKWGPAGSLAYTFAIQPSNNRIRFGAGNSGTFVATYDFATTSIPINAWYHVAITRSGSSVRAFLNGTQIGSTTTVTSNLTASTTCFVGAFTTTTGLFNGYISGFRIVKGTALYTSNFTPPTAPLTAIANTQLLLNGTNAGIFDNAEKNNLVTVGNAQISTSVTKFGTGSMSFDGTGDYLTAISSPQFQFSTGNFTVEAWIYTTSLAVQNTITDFRPTNTNGAYLLLGVKTTGVLFIAVSSADRITSSAGAITTNTWYHVAVSRSGTSTKMFINGVQAGSTYTDTTNYLLSALRIGQSNFVSFPENFTGYIDDLRVTKGIARYTANFTPPTAPFPNQ